MAASIRLVGRLNIVQRTFKRIAIRETYLSRDDIQPPAQRRQIGALTFFQRIYYVYAPTVSNSMLPPPPIVRKAIGAPSHHTAAVANQHRNKHISLSCKSVECSVVASYQRCHDKWRVEQHKSILYIVASQLCRVCWLRYLIYFCKYLIVILI